MTMDNSKTVFWKKVYQVSICMYGKKGRVLLFMVVLWYNEWYMDEKTTLSLRDDEVKNKIRTLYMDGKSMYEISDILGIPKGTIDSAYWRNTHNIRDFFNDLKKELFLRKAEKVSNEIMALQGDKNAKILSIKQKEAEFLRETLGKDQGYSKRIETIGLNINKNEPLDDEQKAKLDKLVKASGYESIKDVEVVDSGSVEPDI